MRERGDSFSLHIWTYCLRAFINNLDAASCFHSVGTTGKWSEITDNIFNADNLISARKAWSLFWGGRQDRRVDVRGLTNSTVVLVAPWRVSGIGTVLEAASSRYHVHPVPWSFESLTNLRAFFSWQLYIWPGLCVENRFTASLTLVSKCNIWCKGSPYCLCLLCYSSWLRQQSCLYPSRTPTSPPSGQAVFQNWTLYTLRGRCWAWLDDAVWALTGPQRGFVARVQNNAPFLVQSAPPWLPQTLRPLS